MLKNKEFLVDKSDLFKTSIADHPMAELKEGEVLLEIEKFAFTSNNVTYAVAGHNLKYWNFFPAQEPWGIIPAWGFAKVQDSKVEGIAVGQRFYGYIPMAKFLKVSPGKLSPYGFSDSSTHRQGLAPIYNYYSLIDSDPSYVAALEDYIPIIRPLFATSFLNYQFLKTGNFFEADQLVLTSASSKTALGLAFLLKENKTEDQKEIIGLTSKGNVAFVKRTGFYDQVLAYDDSPDLLPKQATTLVDFAGKGPLLKEVEQFLGPQLKFISLVGLTDWKAGIRGLKIPVAKFFFAPSFAQEYYKKMGTVQANQQIAEYMHQFIRKIKSDIVLQNLETFEDLSELYTNMLKGEVDPAKGYICHF